MLAKTFRHGLRDDLSATAHKWWIQVRYEYDLHNCSNSLYTRSICRPTISHVYFASTRSRAFAPNRLPVWGFSNIVCKYFAIRGICLGFTSIPVSSFTTTLLTPGRSEAITGMPDDIASRRAIPNASEL